MTFIFINQLRNVVFILYISPRLVECKLDKRVVLFLTQWDALRCEQLLNNVHFYPTAVCRVETSKCREKVLSR